MSYDNHHEWLSLIEISGPFLAVPVLKEAFPQGLEELDGIKRKRLRQAYDEWYEAHEQDDPQLEELHAAWIDEVLSRGLELDEDGRGDVLKRADWCTANLEAILPEHGITLVPDFAVVDEQRANKPLMLIQSYSHDADLDVTLKQDGWAASPAERMVQLCRSVGCRLGLLTNGERWMLIDAPVGAVTTFASWYARIWSQEPVTLQAFVHLLGIRRYFVDESEQLPALFDKSLKYQDEVTDALGQQVQRAVEVLIQALDKADQDRNRELLGGVKEPELYEAALTVMMRLVFLLSAEERGLLLMGDERYESNYALSTLRMQLRKESEEVLERRWDAWSRLLAIFRAVFGGIEHENLRLPALGGSLFDPDRFPFLEGRARGSNWRSDPAKPLPIDNRTVLLLLEAIQQFQGRTLSYLALDVEQIGYVYEGLLERTVKRTYEVTLELDATKSAKTPRVKLAELESARLDGATRFAELLQERSGSSASRVRNDMAKPVGEDLADRLLTACLGDTELCDRIKPYAHFLRTDPWGYPVVYPAGAFVVTTAADRRETGTHYTPKSLTEAIVAETLTPLAYIGPADGSPRDQWVLKSPEGLLDLKICDPAMGSGAFLVQACRWLSDRLVEAWAHVEESGGFVTLDGEVSDIEVAKEPMPRDSEARMIIARRLIAERCLYGVDLNPLAVELAKLSIWLVTLAKGRPFGFLDHNFRCGDSLLGIHRLEQLTEFSLEPAGKGQRRLYGQSIRLAVEDAISLRQQVRKIPIRDIKDVYAAAHLNTDALAKLEVAKVIADSLISEAFVTGNRGAVLDRTLSALAIQAEQAVNGNRDMLEGLRERTIQSLSVDQPDSKLERKLFHWPLEFPEVFTVSDPGFDALIGNPPYRGGSRITINNGVKYRDYLVRDLTAEFVGRVDLCVYFLRQVARLSNQSACYGLVLTKSVAQGHSRDAGLSALLEEGKTVFRAVRDLPWPGAANVVVSLVWLTNMHWRGDRWLNGETVARISASLLEQEKNQNQEQLWAPKPLFENKNLCFRGIEIRGNGFILDKNIANSLIDSDPKNEDVIRPFLTGTELNSNWPKSQETFVICFGDRDQEEAMRYKECWNIVLDKVKPLRDSITKQIHEECFWKFWDKRERQFKDIEHQKEYLVKARDSSEWAFAYVSKECVVSSKVLIFKDNSLYRFACLQSGVHRVWCENGTSTIGQAITYNPTMGLALFPFPEDDGDLTLAAKAYLQCRGKVMQELNVGMNDLYRFTHLSEMTSSEVIEFRNQIAALDKAVVAAFGWHDIRLDHGFHEVAYLSQRNRVRFTISETARLEILRRLSRLNRQAFENAAIQHTSNSNAKGVRKSKARSSLSKSHEALQPSFDFHSNSDNLGVDTRSAPVTEDDVVRAVSNFLKTHSGWHAKSDIVSSLGINDGRWNASISYLLAAGKVKRKGERRGARYTYAGSDD
jgi:Eco57I restriction-modification methylase/MmeI, target recognition domain